MRYSTEALSSFELPIVSFVRHRSIMTVAELQLYIHYLSGCTTDKKLNIGNSLNIHTLSTR
ncbi:MAG: hypothetical protein NPIRA01_02570 [Nitrospirales bacterium]|nr:MAG: hypothetical protein NPIRA01_02570 [Nitrospirales bacterium]